MQGVGYPLDIVVCSALGADMYDCVYPTRTARFGTALVPEVSQLTNLIHSTWSVFLIGHSREEPFSLPFFLFYGSFKI